MSISRRRVYYISGVDPRGPRFYHQMWQTEARLQGPVDGCDYQVSDATDEGDLVTHWTVRAQVEGHQTESHHVFLRWDDLMRAFWPASRLAMVARLPALYWLYLRNATMSRTWTFARPFFWAYFVMPLLYIVLSFLLVGGAGWAAAVWAGSFGATVWLQAVAGIAAAAAVLWAVVENGDKTRLSWLASAQVFMARWAMEAPEAFAQRWRDFAAHIESDLQRDTPGTAPDEVLIVGHCGGAPAAVAVAQRWLELQPPGSQPRVPVKLLTLGQAIPVLGLIPHAQWFRDQLRAVGASRMPWLDYTAPADPLCYALADSFTTCGMDRPDRPDYRVKSARFDRMFLPAEYARLRKDIFRIHFQYLMATQLPVENNYFRLTCGPRPLDLDELAPDAATPRTSPAAAA